MFKQNVASIRLSEKCGMKRVGVPEESIGKDYFEYEIKNLDILY